VPAPDFDRCHRLSHRWDELGSVPHGFEELRKDGRFWLRCDSCQMVKWIEVSYQTGEVIKARYYPQPGYYWSDKNNPARSEPAPMRSDYRLDWLRNLMKTQQKVGT
jgi:hypothetical protein